MCAGMLVHISRHLGKTSNNNNATMYPLYALLSLLSSNFTSDFQLMTIIIL